MGVRSLARGRSVPPDFNLRRLMVPEHASAQCRQCSAKFGLFSRRLNCYHCGYLFCKNCVAQSVSAPCAALPARHVERAPRALAPPPSPAFAGSRAPSQVPMPRLGYPTPERVCTACLPAAKAGGLPNV